MDKLNFDRLLLDLKYFRYYDYLIIVCILLTGSVFIGLVHNCCCKRRRSEYDFDDSIINSGASSCTDTGADATKESNLLSPILVAIALFASFTSGNLMISTSDNMYFFGTQSTVTLLTFLFVGFNLCYFYVPVFYNLQLSSVFEYLELRFSRTTRVIISLIAVIQSLLFITLMTNSTAKAMQSMLNPGIIGFPEIILCGVILSLAIIQCLIGSLKSILYTNIFHISLVFATISAMTGLCIYNTTGNFEEIWERNLNASRIEFTNFDPDLRAENTAWTALIAQYFMVSSFFISTHSCAQRLISMKTLFHARMSLVLLVLFLFMFTLICSMIGFIMTATKFYNNCDPSEIEMEHQFVTASFVLRKIYEFPGMAGLWFVTITFASVSAIANVVHGIGMSLVCDLVQRSFPNASEFKLSVLLKIFICISGGLAFGLQFPLTFYREFIPVVHAIFLVLVGSVCGVFTLAMLFPWANSKGALIGVVASLSAMGVLLWGFQNMKMKGLIPSQTLHLPNHNCHLNSTYGNASSAFQAIGNGSSTYDEIINSDAQESQESHFIPKLTTEHSERWKSQFSTSYRSSKSGLITNYLISISQVWYPALSCLITVLIGLIFSLAVLRWTKKWKVLQECLSPPIIRFWFRLFPNHLKKWIEPEDDLLFLCSNAFPFMPKDKDAEEFGRTKRESVCNVQIRPYHPSLLIVNS